MKNNDAKQQYDEQGYRLFRAALDAGQVLGLGEQAYRAITPYRGELLRQDGKPDFNKYHYGSSFLSNPPLNLHLGQPEGLEPVCEAFKSLITSPAIADSLQALDGAGHYTIHQTILFFSSPFTDLHIDSWTYDTAPPGGFHTVWIPLEEMTRYSGVPAVIPWPRGKIVPEAELGLSAEGTFAERYDRYYQAFARRLYGETPEFVMAFFRPGDFMVWSSTTPHCSLAPMPWPMKRMAIQLLIRPSGTRWGNFCDQTKGDDGQVERATDRFSFCREV